MPTNGKEMFVFDYCVAGVVEGALELDNGLLRFGNDRLECVITGRISIIIHKSVLDR